MTSGPSGDSEKTVDLGTDEGRTFLWQAMKELPRGNRAFYVNRAPGMDHERIQLYDGSDQLLFVVVGRVTHMIAEPGGCESQIGFEGFPFVVKLRRQHSALTHSSQGSKHRSSAPPAHSGSASPS